MAHDNSTSHTSASYDVEVITTIPYYATFHSETIDLILTIKPDAPVWLDSGGGTGYLPEQALPRFPGTHFLLSDPSPAMLDKARQRLTGISSDRLTILPPLRSEELAGRLPLDPDVVTAIQCHHYGGAEARHSATRTIYSLLPAGGVYVTFENIRPDTPEGTSLGLDRWLEFQRRQGRPDAVVEAHRGRFDTEYFPITIRQHLDLLRESGFSVAELFWRSQMQAGFYAIK
jgi:tRNA (cmo5U34)-methyltransferase